ncbi:MAG: hypothetical protein JO166_19250 [Deltaproteobacteria bacterium]|nr:hypothetical protein [Deltaproteobacteria bacterium]
MRRLPPERLDALGRAQAGGAGYQVRRQGGCIIGALLSQYDLPAVSAEGLAQDQEAHQKHLEMHLIKYSHPY